MSEALLAAADRFQRCLEARDAAGLEEVLHDDYALLLLVPGPATMPRDRWLAVLPDYVIHDYECEERSVDEDGDVAAILQRVRMRATVLGEDRSGVFVISDVWRRTPAGWRLWRRHSTPMAAGRLPGV